VVSTVRHFTIEMPGTAGIRTWAPQLHVMGCPASRAASSPLTRSTFRHVRHLMRNMRSLTGGARSMCLVVHSQRIVRVIIADAIMLINQFIEIFQADPGRNRDGDDFDFN
jgi:hypothetical protein